MRAVAENACQRTNAYYKKVSSTLYQMEIKHMQAAYEQHQQDRDQLKSGLYWTRQKLLMFEQLLFISQMKYVIRGDPRGDRTDHSRQFKSGQKIRGFLF